MIKDTKPLSDFVAEKQEVGLDVGVFATQSRDRFALRLVDPDHPEEGTAYLASFASGKSDPKKRVVEADRPHPDVEPGVYDAANKAAAERLNDIVHDSKKSAKFVVCYCVVDEDSIANFGLDEDDLGNTFLSIAYSNRVASDAFAEAKTESASASAPSEASRPTRNRRNSRTVRA